MNLFFRQVAPVLVVLALLGLSRQARAQTTVDLDMTSTTGLTSTIDGWTIAFAPLSSGSCVSLVENPSTFTNSAASSCSAVAMVESATSTRLNLTFQNATAGLPLETAVGSSATACSGGPCSSNYSDLNLNFTVTAPSGLKLSSASLGLTGSATLGSGGNDLMTGDLQRISGGENSTGFVSGLTTSLANNPNQVSTAFNSAVNSFSVSKDLKTNGNGATPGATLALNTVSQTYIAAVPEPASLSLLVVGAAGLAGVRLRRRRG